MITIDQISSICSAMAWADSVIPYKPGQEYEVNLTLPFPFYEALQEEINRMMMTAGAGPEQQPMRFIKLNFPTGVTVHIAKGDGPIIFERRKNPGKVIKMTPDSGYLRPIA